MGKLDGLYSFGCYDVNILLKYWFILDLYKKKSMVVLLNVVDRNFTNYKCLHLYMSE